MNEFELFPLSRGGSDTPWESWVYVNIGGGVEFTFIDLTMNGRWDFPPAGQRVTI